MPLTRKINWPEILLHLLFWSAMFYIVSAFTGLSERLQENINGAITQKIIIRSIFPVSLITLALLMLVFYANIFWLFLKILQYKNGIARFATVAGCTALIFFINYFIVRLLLSFTKISAFEWRQLQLGVLVIFIFTSGLSVAYFFSKAWIRNELLRKQVEANQLTTEIKFLKSQINPHFLFNTLNNLFSMAQEKENDELADGISKLSAMMRYMIYESNAETVPLKKEIEYLENCILLNKLRYADDEAAVTFIYPSAVPDLLIAPMIFIPFVENTFKHGVLIGQSSQIDISIAITGKQVIFNCENKNYSFVKKMDDSTNGIGLENVKRRLDLVYPGKCELVINDWADKYAVELKINLE